MTSTLLFVQLASQNIALFCCGLFAGASTYVSLAEHPTIVEGGTELAGGYLLTAHPRNTVIQSAFAVIGAVAGIVAGFAGSSIWWPAGGFLLGVAALLLLFAVLPATRQFLDSDVKLDPQTANRLFARLARLHAVLSLASLAALFVFILKT